MKKFKKFMQNIDFRNVSKGTVVRGILMVVVVINYALSAFNVNPINLDETVLGNIITVFVTSGTFITSYWENNSWTKAAQEADKKLKELREEVI